MSAAATRHIGLDLGGTNLKWAVVEHAAGDWRTLDTGQEPTAVAGGPAGIVAQIAELAARTADAAGGVASVGVGVPGLYYPELGATRFIINIPGDWDRLPVAAPVTARTGLPATLINDARAFGLAELRLGAGRGARTIVGLTLGTGVGGMVAVDGRLYLGHDGTGGELGHQTIDPDGPWCTCGNRGCLEVFAKAEQIARLCGTRTAAEAFEAAAAGDPRAAWGVGEVGRYLGIGLANTIAMLTPDRVVLGGGVAAAAGLLLPHIRAEIGRRMFITDLGRIEIVTAELGVWAGAIGAAVYGAEQAWAGDAGGPGAIDAARTPGAGRGGHTEAGDAGA